MRGFALLEQTRRRWGCAVGTGMMGMEFADLLRLQQHSAADGELDVRRLLDDEVALDPMAFCRSQAPAGLSLLLRQFGIGGYATSVHTACASGGQAVGTGMKLIRRGTADWVLAGGFDSMITPIGLAGFCLLNALSADNETPERASRPFDATRNGFVLGEGAGFLVLEEWQAARRRGARIYAELAGDGNSLSSYRITDSHPIGRRADPVYAAGTGRRGRSPRGCKLRERARHLHRDERPQRGCSVARRVRRPRAARRGQLDQERDGALDRGSGRGGSGGQRAGDPPRYAAGQCQLERARSRVRARYRARRATPSSRSRSRSPIRWASAARTAASRCAIPRRSTAVRAARDGSKSGHRQPRRRSGNR